MEATATLCLLLRSRNEYSGSPSGTSRSLRLDLRSGPKAGPGGGRGRSALRGRWVGGRVEAASLHSAQSPPLDSAHDFFAEKRGEVGGVCFCFVLFSFPCDVSSPPAPVRAAHATRGRGSAGQVRAEDAVAAASALGTHLSAPAG